MSYYYTHTYLCIAIFGSTMIQKLCGKKFIFMLFTNLGSSLFPPHTHTHTHTHSSSDLTSDIHTTSLEPQHD